MDLAFDGDLTDIPPPAWAGAIDQVVVRGNLIIFTDLIQHFGPKWFTGWRALIARLDLMTVAEPQTPRKFRTAFVGRKAARAALLCILGWPTERVLMAHAPPVETDGAAFIARTFRWLVG